MPGGPRGTQNRGKFDAGKLPGRPVALKSVPKASWDDLGSVSERPRRAPKAPKGSPRAARDAREDAQERPGAHRSIQNRRSVASGSARGEFFRHDAFVEQCRTDFSPFFVDFRSFRNVCEPSEVPRLPAKSRVRPFARRVESLARRSLGKPRKSTRKSTRNRRKSMLRRAWAPERLEKRT